jgi:hypothetical protein
VEEVCIHDKNNGAYIDYNSYMYMMKELWKRRTYPLSSSHLVLEVDEVPIHEVCGHLSHLAQELDTSLAGNEELSEGWMSVQSAQWDSYKKYWWGAYPSC